MASVLEQVRAVAQNYGIPEWIWRPIMDLESGGNPNSRAVTSQEDSRGLFQINTYAHPQYDKEKLYDPAYNADVAFRDFIAPSYAKVATDTSMTPGQQAAYVWRFGIRPAWTTKKEETITAKANAYAAVTPVTDPLQKARAWFQQFLPESMRDKPGESALPFGKYDPQGNPATTDPATKLLDKYNPMSYVSSFLSNLSGNLVSIVLLIVGLIILFMVLKSMFLGGEKIVVVEGGSHGN